jgi:hypothetical protein
MIFLGIQIMGAARNTPPPHRLPERAPDAIATRQAKRTTAREERTRATSQKALGAAVIPETGVLVTDCQHQHHAWSE